MPFFSGVTWNVTSFLFVEHDIKYTLQNLRLEPCTYRLILSLEAIVYKNYIHIQLCLDVKGDQFQHRLWAGPAFHRSRYVYINIQVIISITQFFIDDSLGPIATESPCIFIFQFAVLNFILFLLMQLQFL